MSRTVLTLLGVLFISATALGQEFVVPQNKTFQANRAAFQPPRPAQFKTVSQQEPEPPAPASIQPSILVPQKNLTTGQAPVDREPSVELPAPRPPVQTELKEDRSVYRRTPQNTPGISDHRVQVARELARSRRMRMEAKKWYGIDSARPTVVPQGHLPTYSAYYNGVFSRPGYRQNASRFYFHVPVAR